MVVTRKVAILLGILAVAAFALPSWLRTADENIARSLATKEGHDRGWGFVFVRSVERQSNLWTVTIERFPYELGGHAAVEIVDGKVIRYTRGK